MRIKVTTVLIHDLVNNLIDAMHDNKQGKILEYSCYIEGSLGILSLEERREILKIYIPLFKNDSYLSFYLLNIFVLNYSYNTSKLVSIILYLIRFCNLETSRIKVYIDFYFIVSFIMI